MVADLNGDGRPDIAYYGEPKELIVLYNQGTNGWSAPKRWPIEDGQLSPNALSTGDLNGDGRTDLVLLAENHVYFLPQKEDHTLGEPRKDSRFRHRQVRAGGRYRRRRRAAICCW